MTKIKSYTNVTIQMYLVLVCLHSRLDKACLPLIAQLLPPLPSRASMIMK